MFRTRAKQRRVTRNGKWGQLCCAVQIKHCARPFIVGMLRLFPSSDIQMNAR